MGDSQLSANGSSQRQPGTGVAYAAEAIRQLIATGRANPGQQLRQEQLAHDLGISRAPVREALQALMAEGVVEHSPNVGYSVVRLTAEALEQIYRMRTLLETELYKGSVPIRPGLADELTDLNEQMGESAARGDRFALMERNRDFHFRIFASASLVEIEREVARLWAMSQPYRAVYIYDPATTRRVLDEHRQLITALVRGDEQGVVREADRHRGGTERQIDTLLIRTASAASTAAPATT